MLGALEDLCIHDVHVLTALASGHTLRALHRDQRHWRMVRRAGIRLVGPHAVVQDDFEPTFRFLCLLGPVRSGCVGMCSCSPSDDPLLPTENRKSFAQAQFPTAASASESWWWPFGKKERSIIILFGPPGAGQYCPQRDSLEYETRPLYLALPLESRAWFCMLRAEPLESVPDSRLAGILQARARMRPRSLSAATPRSSRLATCSGGCVSACSHTHVRIFVRVCVSVC